MRSLRASEYLVEFTQAFDLAQDKLCPYAFVLWFTYFLHD